MTKEELWIEADKYVTTTGNNDCTIDAYIASAEPREKRIEELEQQIEKMKCCGNCKYSNQESAYTIVCKVGGVDKTDYIATDDNQVCDKWEIKE